MKRFHENHAMKRELYASYCYEIKAVLIIIVLRSQFSYKAKSLLFINMIKSNKLSCTTQKSTCNLLIRITK